MDEHAKLQRTLSLLLLLMGIRRYSKQEILEKYSIAERTFYRYISTFRNVGLIVEHENGYYEIKKIEPQFKEISELLHFSEEEAQILNRAIHAIDDNNLMKSNLRKKLFSIYDFDRIPEIIVHPENSKNIQKIISAIKNKKQIRLIGYQSAHGQSITDRLVEAFDISANYQMIWAYDIAKKKNLQFKVSRISNIETLDKVWVYEKIHKKQPMDVFRISGEKAEKCVMKLNLRARNLLLEEYPLSEKDIEEVSETEFIFSTVIYGYQGVGRFCMGLIEDVEIMQPRGLKECIYKKMEKILAERDY